MNEAQVRNKEQQTKITATRIQQQHRQQNIVRKIIV